MFVKPQCFASRLPDRFLSKVAVDSSTGCWNWTGCKEKRIKPGKFAGKYLYKGKCVRSYRACYDMIWGIVGVIDIHHLCGNPLCVNPLHIEAVTEDEHYIIDHPAKGRKYEQCKRGHPVNESNTKTNYWPDGTFKGRTCYECNRIYNRERNLRLNPSIKPRGPYSKNQHPYSP